MAWVGYDEQRNSAVLMEDLLSELDELVASANFRGNLYQENNPDLSKYYLNAAQDYQDTATKLRTLMSRLNVSR